MIHPEHVKILSGSLAGGGGEKPHTCAGVSRGVRSRPLLQKPRDRIGDLHLLQSAVWSGNEPIVSVHVWDDGNICDSFRLTQALVIKEEKGPVLADRAAQRKS